MSAFFDAIGMGPSHQDPTPESAPPLNSEMDDLPLEEGEEFPDADQLMDLVGTFDQKASALEKSDPVQTSVAQSSSAKGKGKADQAIPDIKVASEDGEDIGDQGSTGEGSHAPDIPDDILSLTTDVNNHTVELGSILTRLAALEAQVKSIPALDTRVRQLETALKNEQGQVDILTESLKALKTAFNAYQTKTVNSIADVERRAFTKQLTETPRVDVEDFTIPEDITQVRAFNAATDVAGSSTGPSVPKKGPKKVVITDDW